MMEVGTFAGELDKATVMMVFFRVRCTWGDSSRRRCLVVDATD